MTFLHLPMQPSLGQTYTTAQYRLPPHFSTRPVTTKTPVSFATRSRNSRVPSPRYSSPLATGSFRSTQSSPTPAGISPRSGQPLKYCRNCSRPSSDLEPTVAPKPHVRGYPPKYASGNKSRSTPWEAASRVVDASDSRVSCKVERVRDCETASLSF